jgi:hypothetical protein
VSIIIEHAEPVASAAEGRTCEAIWTFAGMNALCGVPAAGLFRRACVHEHIRDGWLCRDHVENSQNGCCRTCDELADGLAHDCPISISDVTAEAAP